MRAVTPTLVVFALASAALACDSERGEPDDAAEASEAQSDAAAANDAADPAPKTAAAPGAAAVDNQPSNSDANPLTLPPMRDPAPIARYETTAESEYRIAQAFQFDAPVFRAPNAARKVVGLVRRNTRLAVDRWVPGDGCSKSWYALVGGGFVCTGEGFAVSSDPAPLSEALQVGVPSVERPLPYRYAKVKTPAPLFWRLPTEHELATGATGPIREQAQGAHFVAMDQTKTVGDTTLHRTVRGFYIREADLEQKPLPTMHGEKLSGADALPLAFVHTDDAPLLDAEGTIIGQAEKFSRFPVDTVVERDGNTRVLSSDGPAVAREHVRIARTRKRPSEIPAGDKWIHLDLAQQVLVAYEGDTPVLATLVSSGKEGFEPPLGLFRVHKKYTSVTMSGPDPDAGTYAVEQVPWTMYYWGSFALHGAYWHDEFGNVRSHGCTNIPPIDARFLFYWSDPTLPTGWHAEVGLKGPWVYFTKGEATNSGPRGPAPTGPAVAP